jgi:hypothetical protein
MSAMVSRLAEQHEPAQVETYSNHQSSYVNHDSFHRSFNQSFRASSDPNLFLLDDDSDDEGDRRRVSSRVSRRSIRSSRDVAEPAAISAPSMRKTVSCSIMGLGQPRDSIPRPGMRKPSIRGCPNTMSMSNTSSNYQWNTTSSPRRNGYDSLPRPGTRRESTTLVANDSLQRLALDRIPQPSSRRASLHASFSGIHHNDNIHTSNYRPNSMRKMKSTEEEPYDSLPRPGIRRDSHRCDRQPVSPNRRESAPRSYHHNPSYLPRESSQVSVVSDGKSRSLHHHQQRSTTSTITIEVQPGLSLPLRGKDETLSAIANNFCTKVHCMACTMELTCIANAEYVLCPVCKSISPIENNHTAPSFGVGLGSTEVY